MINRCVLLLRTFLAWLLRPRIMLLILLAVVLGGVVFVLTGHPAVFVALKKFVSSSMPRLGARILRSIGGRQVKRLVFFVGGLLMLNQLKGPIERWLSFLSLRKEKVLKWWESRTLQQKILYVGVVLAVAAIPLGYWIIYFVPVVILKDAIFFVARKVGLVALLNKLRLSDRIWNLLPERFQKRYVILVKWRLMRSLVKQRKRMEQRVEKKIKKGKETALEYKAP